MLPCVRARSVTAISLNSLRYGGLLVWLQSWMNVSSFLTLSTFLDTWRQRGDYIFWRRRRMPLRIRVLDANVRITIFLVTMQCLLHIGLKFCQSCSVSEQSVEEMWTNTIRTKRQRTNNRGLLGTTDYDTPFKLCQELTNSLESRLMHATSETTVFNSRNENLASLDQSGPWSRALKNAQRSCGSTKRECPVAVWVVLLLRSYVKRSRFIVRTDRQALKFILDLNDSSGCLDQWRLRWRSSYSRSSIGLERNTWQ